MQNCALLRPLFCLYEHGQGWELVYVPLAFILFEMYSGLHAGGGYFGGQKDFWKC